MCNNWSKSWRENPFYKLKGSFLNCIPGRSRPAILNHALPETSKVSQSLWCFSAHFTSKHQFLQDLHAQNPWLQTHTPHLNSSKLPTLLRDGRWKSHCSQKSSFTQLAALLDNERLWKWSLEGFWGTEIEQRCLSNSWHCLPDPLGTSSSLFPQILP